MWVYGGDGDLWEHSIPINQRKNLFIYIFLLSFYSSIYIAINHINYPIIPHFNLAWVKYHASDADRVWHRLFTRLYPIIQFY